MIKRIQILMCSLAVVINPCLVAMKGAVAGEATRRVSKAELIHEIQIPDLLADSCRYIESCLALKNGNIAVGYNRGIGLFDGKNYACIEYVKTENSSSCLVEVDEGRVAFIDKSGDQRQLKILGADTCIDLPDSGYEQMLFLGNSRLILNQDGSNITEINIGTGNAIKHKQPILSSIECMVQNSPDTFMAIGQPCGGKCGKVPQKFVIFNHDVSVRREGNFDSAPFKSSFMDITFGSRTSGYKSLNNLFVIQGYSKVCGTAVSKFLIFDPKNFAVTESFDVSYTNHLAVNENGLLAYLDSGCDSERIVVRNLAKHQEETVISLWGLEFHARRVAVTDDNRLVVGCDDGVIRIWNLNAVLAE